MKDFISCHFGEGKLKMQILQRLQIHCCTQNRGIRVYCHSLIGILYMYYNMCTTITIIDTHLFVSCMSFVGYRWETCYKIDFDVYVFVKMILLFVCGILFTDKRERAFHKLDFLSDIYSMNIWNKFKAPLVIIVSMLIILDKQLIETVWLWHFECVYLSISSDLFFLKYRSVYIAI